MSDTSIEVPADAWQTVVDQFLAGATKHIDAKKTAGVISVGVANAFLAMLDGLSKAIQPLAVDAGKVLIALEEPILPVFAGFMSPIVGGMFGTDADPSLFSSRDNTEGRSQASAALVDAFLSAITGDAGGEIEPGDTGAKRLAGAGVHAAIEGWFNAWILEMLGDCVPWDWMHFKEMTKLPEDITRSLGIGRLVRRAIAPLVDATCSTPMKWQANKTYRPNMLGDADVVKAFLRGDYSAAEAREELARAGYTERRMDVLLAGALKSLSVDDALALVRDGQVDRDFVIANLRAAGYDEPGARMQLNAAETKQLAAIHDDSFAAVRAAYVDRRITDSEFEQFLPAIFPSDEIRAAHEVAARTIRDVNTKALSASQAEACVLAKVLPIAAYRDALTREGYEPDAALALELLLETRIDAAADVDTLRKQKAERDAASARAKADELAKKKADAERAAALKRRGPISELERAAVRGLIPIARVAEVLAADYDADTVQLYVADIEGQRAAYVAQQQKADDAAKRASNKGLNLGQLEQAVLDGVLTMQDFSMQLSRFELTPADQAILVATLTARKADADAAAAKRRDAETRAQLQKVNLGTFEQLVRAGIRSLADYDGLLTSLGYGDADRASLAALLQQRIDADAAAKQLRDDTRAQNAARGLSLDQARRAVVLGVRTVDDFQTWLVQQKYTVDAASVLVDELRDDVARADAARTKRETTASSSGAAGVPLSTVTRAARLGILTPTQYQAALVARGYSADDVALELDLLSQEIANVKSAKQQQAAADAGQTDTALSLAQLATAVKAGEASLAFYRSRALTLGLSDDDADTLTRVLGDELANTTAAKARRTALESTVKPGDVALAVVEQRVRDGSLRLSEFVALLTDAGLDPVDVDLLANLLTDEVGGDAA